MGTIATRGLLCVFAGLVLACSEPSDSTDGAGGTAGVGGVAGMGGFGGRVLGPGECWTISDCREQEPAPEPEDLEVHRELIIGLHPCIPSEYEGAIPPSEAEIGDSPGICDFYPPSNWLSFYETAPGTNTEGGFSVRAGQYQKLDERTTYWKEYPTSAYYVVDLPYSETGFAPEGVYVVYALEQRIHVIAVDDPSFEVDCSLTFNAAGELVDGGVILGPGELGERNTSIRFVCPTDEPGSMAILFEYEHK